MLLDRNDNDLDTWLKKQQYKNFKPNKLCMYMLSVILRCHTIVYTEYQPWCTVDRKPGMCSETIEEAVLGVSLSLYECGLLNS